MFFVIPVRSNHRPDTITRETRSVPNGRSTSCYPLTQIVAHFYYVITNSRVIRIRNYFPFINELIFISEQYRAITVIAILRVAI